MPSVMARRTSARALLEAEPPARARAPSRARRRTGPPVADAPRGTAPPRAAAAGADCRCRLDRRADDDRGLLPRGSASPGEMHPCPCPALGSERRLVLRQLPARAHRPSHAPRPHGGGTSRTCDRRGFSDSIRPSMAYSLDPVRRRRRTVRGSRGRPSRARRGSGARRALEEVRSHRFIFTYESSSRASPRRAAGGARHVRPRSREMSAASDDRHVGAAGACASTPIF